MTREEAINVINNADLSKVEDRVIKAIFYLCTDKALEQEPCEDAISRQAVEKITWEEPSYTDALNVLTEVREKIRQLPSVTPQPKIGHWIKQVLPVKPFGEDAVLCDLCAFMTDKDSQYKYCPNCGAKMEEVEENDT